jgi:hypothetical protein
MRGLAYGNKGDDESALADLLAERACKTGSSYSDISSYYRVMSAVESGGTSTTRRLARYRETWRWSDSRRLPTAALHHTQMLELATGSERGYFVAYPEIVFFSRRYKTASSGSYFLFPEHLAKALIRFQSAPAEPMQTIVEQHQSGRGPDAASRAKERWKVFVRVMAVGGGGKVAVARGSDCYGTTASIVAAAVTYLSSTTPHAHGVMGPADLLPAELLGRFGAVEEFDLR